MCKQDGQEKTEGLERMKKYKTTKKCCGKKRFATDSAAEAYKDWLNSTSQSEVTPQRSYQCHNGWWHLTSESRDEYLDKIFERREKQ